MSASLANPRLEPALAASAIPSSQLRAQAFFFESGDRPLYAVYHPTLRPRPGAPVLVHCHTLGVEQVTAYRVETQNARAAAAMGFPAFRYHSRGHGDSAGDFESVTFETLVEDALAAAAKARQCSGAARVIWVGVRFGALVAAQALRREGGAAGLALWEPVHKPHDYFRAMLRNVLFSQVVKGKKPSTTVEQLVRQIEQEGKVDVHGYYLHRALYISARGLDLASQLDGWRGPTLLAQVQRRSGLAAAHAALIATLEKAGAGVTAARVDEEPGWHFISNPAWEGADLVRHTADWLDALA